MPFGSVRLMPGVNVERTPTLLEAGYVSALFARFRDGLFEKIGGWVKFYPFAVGGVPRCLHAWQDYNNVNRLAVGSTTAFGIVNGSSFTDITPQTFTTNPAVNISTTVGSTTVTIIDPAVSTPTIFDSVYFNTPIAVGGIVLSAGYAITVVTGATSFQITASIAATSTVTGGAVPSFTTVSGSSTVSVTIAAHALAVGNAVNFPIATAGAGVTIFGTYTVTAITSSSVFTVTASSQASSGATFSMNSGNAEYVYYIALGPTAAAVGYGVGTYGAGGYGTGVVGSIQTGTKITATDWTLDNWGSDIVGCPQNGGIYYWDPNGGFQNAALVSPIPMFNTGIFVAMPAQIMVAYGSTADQTISANALAIGSTQNPLLIRWSDQQNFLSWVPTAVNQAGSFLVPTGSQIVGGMQASQAGLIWTDIDVWSMVYAGGTGLIFAFSKIAGGCGLVGKHARCQIGSTVYWCSQASFFKLDGSGVMPVPCPVWDSVFQQIDRANIGKAVMGANEPFNEIWFEFPVAGGSGENAYRVTMNVLDGTWTDPSPIARSAWIGQSLLGFPIAATPSGIIYQHEVGYDADGAPMTPMLKTGYFEIAEGEDYSFVDRIYPDFKWGTYAGSQTANVSLSILVVNYPGDTPQTFGPYAMTQSTEYISLRARGRQMAFVITSSDNGSFWRLGRVRYRYAPAGRR